MSLDIMYNTVIENIDTYEKMITILVPLAGGIVAIFKWLSSIYATAMSSPVEVTLMTKKEQYKYKNSNHMMIWIAFSALLIYIGFFSLLYSFEQGKNVEVVAIEDEQRVHAIEGEGTASDANTAENVEQSDMMNVIIYIVGFYGILGISVIIIVLFVLWAIKSLVSFIKNIRKYLNKKNIFWGVSGLVTVVLCILFFCTANIWIFFTGGIVWALIIWYIVRRGYTCIEVVVDVLKFISVVFLLVILVAVNNMYIWTVENYNTFLSTLIMALGSIILSAILCMLMLLFAKSNINQTKAKVKYYNKRLEKNLYLYFRFKDEFFIAGEKGRIEECESYYFVKVDEVIGERLDRVTTQSVKHLKVYSENIANRE